MRCIGGIEGGVSISEVRERLANQAIGESQAMSPLWHALLCGRCMQVKMTLY